jgi:large subunit ribosomal protein L32
MNEIERRAMAGAREERNTMPNPKRRHSKARTSKRRAHDHLTAHSAAECPNCHEKKMPHRICPKCGYYKGREVVEVKETS